MKLNPREYHCIHHSGVFLDPLGSTAECVVGQSYWVEGMKLGDVKLIHDVLKRANISEPMYPWSPADHISLRVGVFRKGLNGRKNLPLVLVLKK